MTKLESGQNYTALRVRSGQSGKGAWELIVVSDPNGKNEVTIFPRNCPTGIVEGQQFNLQEIHMLKFGYKKDKNERWQPNCTIDATVHKIESEFDSGITGGGETWPDEPLPWETDMPL